MSSDQARYPILLFKAGIGALSTDYTSLCEDLARHGYIVVASDAPYSTYYREHDSFNTNYSIRSRIANMLLVEKTLHRLRLLLTAT